MEIKEDYSDKSFAVYGETKKFKDILKNLGGRFNKNLKINDEIKVGWIFSKKNQENVVDFVMKANAGETFTLDTSSKSLDTSSKSLETPNKSLDLPNFNSSGNKTSVYQYVKYKVYKPKANQKVELKLNGNTMTGKVTGVEMHDDIVDTAYLNFDGQEQLAVICNGKWTIFGYFHKHNLYFSDVSE
jgi:hypothetical protein